VTISHPSAEQGRPASPTEHEVGEPPTVDGERISVVTTFRQHVRRAKAVRELRRLIRSAPTATIRNDLMTIAARNDRFS